MVEPAAAVARSGRCRPGRHLVLGAMLLTQTTRKPTYLVVLVAPQDKAPGWVIQASNPREIQLIPLGVDGSSGGQGAGVLDQGRRLARPGIAGVGQTGANAVGAPGQVAAAGTQPTVRADPGKAERLADRQADRADSVHWPGSQSPLSERFGCKGRLRRPCSPLTSLPECPAKSTVQWQFEILQVAVGVFQQNREESTPVVTRPVSSAAGGLWPTATCSSSIHHINRTDSTFTTLDTPNSF